MTAWLDDDTNLFDRSEDSGPAPEAVEPDMPVIPVDDAADQALALEVNRTVAFGGREFVIDEPDTQTILAILNFVGMLGLRANRYAGQNFKGLFVEEGRDGKKTFVPPAEATIFAMLSVVAPSDIARLAILALFGGGKDAEKEGREWLQTVPEKDVKLAPLVKALSLRIALAEDLRDALKNLQFGALMLPR